MTIREGPFGLEADLGETSGLQQAEEIEQA